jgi:hypothetical protein
VKLDREAHMRRWTLAAVLVAAGCGGGESPEEAFRAALPPEGLRMTVPGGEAAALAVPGMLSAGPGVLSSALVGQTAELYALTRRTSDGLNGMVGGILASIWGIARQPPSAVGPDAAVWGPFTPVLSPATFRLVVERRPDRLVFHLDARPKGAGDDAFRPVAAGGPDPAAPPERAAGEFAVDLSLLHTLDPVGHPLAGAMGVRHDLGPGGGSIAVHLQDLAGPGEPPLTADYRYALGPGGEGVFRFAAHADLLGGPEQLEDGLIVSRWTPAGAGRADARVTGGDAGAGADASECWDDLFARVWFAFGPSQEPPVEEGDPSRCAFAEPLVPGR